jgi:hypothetical protein
MTLYRCQLERLGAPRWACAFGGVVLGLTIVAYLSVISVSLWTKPNTPRWPLALLWGLGVLGVALAARSVLASLRNNPDSDAGSVGRPSPSNNRWRGP